MEKVSYALRDRNSGALARLYVDQSPSWGGGDDDEPLYAMLSRDEGLPVYEVESPATFLGVLRRDFPAFQPSPEYPALGDFKAEDLEPVELRTVVTVTQSEVTLPLAFDRGVETRDLPRKLAMRYAGSGLAQAARYTMSVVPLPAGTTLEDVAARLGELAFFWGMPGRILGVSEVPEEYAELLGDREGVVVVYGPS